MGDRWHISWPSSKIDEYEASAIWIASTDRARETRQFTTGETHDWYPRWSPGGGQIAFTRVDEPTEEDEKEEKERDDACIYGEKWRHARLRLLSLATREVTTVATGGRHIADFTWHPHGTEIAYLVLKTPDLEARAHEAVIERIPIAGGEPQAVCHFPFAVHSLTWSQDGGTLFFMAPVAKKSQSSSGLYAIPVQGGEPLPIASGETNCVAEVRAIQQIPSLAILIGEGLGSRIDLLDLKNGESTTLLDGMDGECEVEYTSWDVRRSEDGKLTAAVIRIARDQPWEVWAGQGQVDQNAKGIASRVCRIPTRTTWHCGTSASDWYPEARQALVRSLVKRMRKVSGTRKCTVPILLDKDDWRA
jgi:dipeptidyl aminopeptidase/acylaminoacyl peptidase